MQSKEILELSADLIAIPSVSLEEKAVAIYLQKLFSSWGWRVELAAVQTERFNVLVTFGAPQIVFTTHIDVVPAAKELFHPRREGERLIGRGACDAKGIVATMIAAASQLEKQGRSNFALLFVVGEELDGAGAIYAAQKLAHLGVRYIINGEPTEGKIVTAHKGAVEVTLEFLGSSAHSGYPELGEDANLKLIRAAKKIIEEEFPVDPELGKTTLNFGMISGGVAGNVVSAHAKLTCLARTVSDSELFLRKLSQICGTDAEINVGYNVPVARMLKVPGFDQTIAAFCTDIPNFAPLNAEAVLYGPGSIHLAHTDRESISLSEVDQALEGYLRIYEYLDGELRS